MTVLPCCISNCWFYMLHCLKVEWRQHNVCREKSSLPTCWRWNLPSVQISLRLEHAYRNCKFFSVAPERLLTKPLNTLHVLNYVSERQCLVLLFIALPFAKSFGISNYLGKFSHFQFLIKKFSNLRFWIQKFSHFQILIPKQTCSH